MRTEPEIWFRIVHVAQDRHRGADGATCEQRVEIALGPKGAFENRNVGAVTRRVSTDRVVSAVPRTRRPPRPLRQPRTPRIVELLRTALAWQTLLESGEAASQAEIARLEGISRARVTQVMGMLRLAPEIQHCILAMRETIGRSAITERALRPIGSIDDTRQQKQAFKTLVAVSAAT
jgi:hypothetical protein